MRTNIIKKIFIMCIIFPFIFSITVFAEQERKIGILPFKILADVKKENLAQDVSIMIAENLKKNGIKTIFIKDIKQTVSFSYQEIYDIGIKHSTDYLIWGTVFITGEKISLDTKIINIFEKGISPLLLFSETQGIENLAFAAQDLSTQIVSEIFQKKLITKISVNGNKRIESDAILGIINIKTGELYNSDLLSENLKNIFKMGYFKDVHVQRKTRDKGIEIIFNVLEKPSVRKIVFKGNQVYEDQEVQDSIATKTGSILNIFTINKDVSRIKKLYTEKNYHNSTIKYKLINLDHNQADIEFSISEGNKIRIEKMIFEGNSFFSNKKIKKIIKTKKKGLFYWVTSSGEFDKNELEQDVVRLESFYKNQGFIDAKVAEPEIEYEKKGITIKFKIKEGFQYKIGKIDFKGDLIIDKKELIKKIELKQSELYSRQKLRSDMMIIADVYGEKGFANANIVPFVKPDLEKKLVNIIFTIEKKLPVYFERINIAGNTKTRDKVIRRQIKVQEQELYSLSGIQKSVKNLRRIDYFDNVQFKTSKGSKDDTIDLNINITEKATGAFSFGGGYSNENNMFGMLSVSERNLFGNGQILSLKGELSGSSSKFTLSFTEPWLFDIPMSAGFDLYNWDKEYDYYDKDSKGGALRLGYMIYDHTYLSGKYAYEDFEITNVQETKTTVDAGNYLTSSFTTAINYDSRNKIFNPTQGAKHIASIEYADKIIGSEIEFTKYIAETGWYYPIFKKFVGYVHGKVGYLDDRTDDSINIDYERFYLGGLNSIRGYDWQDIYADSDAKGDKIGGQKFIQFNVELLFPLLESEGLPSCFFDTGDVYTKSQNIKF